ncbi:AlbA family DNA-binding domain-containing protein [Nocardia vinacea]|uniref:AlbA family DNA-binding domain-containing protein n=1 Tax=Nocardia vinacea TaxID=96468 RepID=UPI0012F6D045|nr:RNA-binding domain-containing protein [Nocardia vinacea]
MPIRAELSDDHRFVVVTGDDFPTLQLEEFTNPSNIAKFRVDELINAFREGLQGADYIGVGVYGGEEFRWGVLNFKAVNFGRIEIAMEVICPAGEPSHSAVLLAKNIIERNFTDGLEFSTIRYTEYEYVWCIEFYVEHVEYEFHELFDLFDGIARLVDLENPRRVVDLGSARRALTGGVPELLVGLLENSWLDAKSQLYDLTKHSQRIELAKDVAQFANSPGGGLLVIGMRTRNSGGGDRIEKLVPTTLPGKIIERYRKTIDQRVFPPITDLEISVCKASRGELLYVYVPPQSERARPFIVEGTAAGEELYENFFMIPQRRGDASYSVSARSLHSLIAGKLLYDADDSDRNLDPQPGHSS